MPFCFLSLCLAPNGGFEEFGVPRLRDGKVAPGAGQRRRAGGVGRRRLRPVGAREILHRRPQFRLAAPPGHLFKSTHVGALAIIEI